MMQKAGWGEDLDERESKDTSQESGHLDRFGGGDAGIMTHPINQPP